MFEWKEFPNTLKLKKLVLVDVDLPSRMSCDWTAWKMRNLKQLRDRVK